MADPDPRRLARSHLLVEEQELHTNTEITKKLETLTREIHAVVVGPASTSGGPPRR